MSVIQKLARRLPLLLAFRAAVATVLLLLTLSADFFNWHIKVISVLLYGVAIGTYAVVLALAVLLHTKTPPVVISTIHLVTSVMAAFIVVEGTGGVESAFSFLYLLAVLDAAIIGGSQLALIVATACTMAYGGQLIMQVYGFWPNAQLLPTYQFINLLTQPHMFITSFVTHVTAFYLSAFLSGQLADLWHRAEATAEKAQIELVAQEHMASLGKLSAAMAHEIRNPLAAISGCVELLVETPDPQTQARLKGIILREVHRLNNLIEEFLVYSRPMPPRLFRTDLCALTRETCDVIKTHDVAQMHNIDVVAPERLEASVDAGQIRQMLWNLLKNALEASPEHAPVQISLAASSEQQIILEIHDNGAGISPEMRQFLFEPFHTTKPQGTGLGLAVVKRIVDGHGGDIRFISQEGNGTTTRVILPVSLS